MGNSDSDSSDPNDSPYEPPVQSTPEPTPEPSPEPDFDGQTLEVQHVTDDSTACLDVQVGQTRPNGQDVWTWECNETDAQKWTFEKRTAGDYSRFKYRLVSKLGNYCLDNRGDFSTSDPHGYLDVASDDTHGAAANQSVTIAASGDGYTLTFTNGSKQCLAGDGSRRPSNPRGGANQTTVSGTAGALAIWRIGSSSGADTWSPPPPPQPVVT